jgi:hypothetical protein
VALLLRVLPLARERQAFQDQVAQRKEQTAMLEVQTQAARVAVLQAARQRQQAAARVDQAL